MSHPGAVEARGERNHYSDGFRAFVLGLLAPGSPAANLSLESLASQIQVPLGTLKEWLRAPSRHPSAPEGPPSSGSPPPVDPIEIRGLQVGTILREFPLWEGTFTGFCEFLRKEHQVPYGDTFIGSVLKLAGLRVPSRRPRQGEAPWSEGRLQVLFPGFQWFGDGKTFVVEWNGERFAFNGEALVDPAAGSAILGFRVSDTEDEAVVLAAYAEAFEAAGGPPLALTLDNRPSNLTERIHKTIAPATLLPATPGRGQSKAPVEGTFGLFSQTAPELVVVGDTRRDLARSVLQLVLSTFAWARNHKPRKKLDGRSPIEAYRQAAPTPDDITRAREQILELERRAREQRRTEEARSDPVRLQILREELARLEIPDPEDRLAVKLARYSRQAILQGLAIFLAKRDEATLPEDRGDWGAYLGGIIRNVHHRRELEATARHLLELRIRAGDLSRDPLEAEATRLAGVSSAVELPSKILQRALDSETILERTFWSNQLEDAMARLPERIARALYSALARRIAGAFHLTKRQRLDLIAALSGGAAAAILDTG